MLFVLDFLLCLLFFHNFGLRAVEVFIRDKYEKKKYYGKNVTNGNSVCIIYSRRYNLKVHTVNSSLHTFKDHHFFGFSFDFF